MFYMLKIQPADLLIKLAAILQNTVNDLAETEPDTIYALSEGIQMGDRQLITTDATKLMLDHSNMNVYCMAERSTMYNVHPEDDLNEIFKFLGGGVDSVWVNLRFQDNNWKDSDRFAPAAVLQKGLTIATTALVAPANTVVTPTSTDEEKKAADKARDEYTKNKAVVLKKKGDGTFAYELVAKSDVHRGLCTRPIDFPYKKKDILSIQAFMETIKEGLDISYKALLRTATDIQNRYDNLPELDMPNESKIKQTNDQQAIIKERIANLRNYFTFIKRGFANIGAKEHLALILSIFTNGMRQITEMERKIVRSLDNPTQYIEHLDDYQRDKVKNILVPIQTFRDKDGSGILIRYGFDFTGWWITGVGTTILSKTEFFKITLADIILTGLSAVSTVMGLYLMCKPVAQNIANRIRRTRQVSPFETPRVFKTTRDETRQDRTSRSGKRDRNRNSDTSSSDENNHDNASQHHDHDHQTRTRTVVVEKPAPFHYIHKTCRRPSVHSIRSIRRQSSHGTLPTWRYGPEPEFELSHMPIGQYDSYPDLRRVSFHE